MSNDFVFYLNSLHNANAASENALAESQITSRFYHSMTVELEIANSIIKNIKEKPSCIIITGHAGDGKTSLLAQILLKLDLIEDREPLPLPEKRSSEKIPNGLFFIKDMSEMNQKDQEKYLSEAITSPESNSSAIIITNTGPLLNTFTRLSKKPGFYDDLELMQSKILGVLDNNTGDITVCNHNVTIINLARIDNSTLIKPLLSNIVTDQHWESCFNCDCAKNCPIYSNSTLIKASFKQEDSQLLRFLQTFYVWQNENDCRLTIRQIQAQIAFGITGGKDCDSIRKLTESVDHLFVYGFANLFFGYEGISPINKALQLRGIREVNSLNLDSKSTFKDYSLFVLEDETAFPSNLADYIFTYYRKNMKTNEFKQFEYRNELRRFYILFGNLTDNDYTGFLRSCFSKAMPLFLSARTSEIRPGDYIVLNQKVFQALYYSFLGVLPESNEENLYLTLRRRNSEIQPVQINYGRIDISEIKVVSQLSENETQFSKTPLALRIKDNTYDLNLPLLNYFYEVADGRLSTDLSPSLSHGIERIKAEIIKKYGNNEQEALSLVIFSDSAAERINLYFEDNYIIV